MGCSCGTLGRVDFAVVLAPVYYTAGECLVILPACKSMSKSVCKIAFFQVCIVNMSKRAVFLSAAQTTRCEYVVCAADALVCDMDSLHIYFRQYLRFLIPPRAVS